MTTAHNLLLAPLAGISDYPFRQICREFGADLTFTEMISVEGLIQRNWLTRQMISVKRCEKPVGIQLFGKDPDSFERAVSVIHELAPDVIDLNFGCPVQKVVKKGAGAALLKDLSRMEKIVRMAAQGPLPVTAKIRIGWDLANIVAVDAARAVEAGGAAAVTVHARTRNQGYSGKAHWEYIARVKEAVQIPVIGNGDVVDGPSARDLFRLTGADGIMLARGVLGRPWVFDEILRFLECGEGGQAPAMEERLEILKRHYRLAAEEYGNELALRRMKKLFVWYTHGMPFATGIRNQIFRMNNFSDVEQLLSNYADRLRRRAALKNKLSSKKVEGLVIGKA
ncbi:MAG: tRNA dihydrouridine synthase DusB [Calditrichia bacterium]